MNHSPDEKSPAGLDSDELALRSLLHEVVQEIEPRDGTLDHLRRAVPARRARKRQAAVGMAAAALFIGTAVPALLHVSHSVGSDADPSIAGNSSQAQGGSGSGKGPDGGSSISGGAGGNSTGPGQDDPEGPGRSNDTGTATGASGTADPSASIEATAPTCTAGQLGSATASADVPDSAGIVYGTFRVTNVSTVGCAVGGGGSVTPLAQGAADATRITVVEHAAGDAAAGLPDPSLYVPQLTIAPGSAYEVKFAWVPSATCPTTGGNGGTDTGSPSPDPSPTGAVGSTSSGSSTGSDGTSTQMLAEDGTADGSVVVSHTPEAGSPSAAVTVSNACAGTVYRTGVLAAS
ncbi:hypothetical protein ACFV0T_07755 [Streptomyces sp. NPDC059582]|uniref:hypothetical protein n=1 Tax=Streptomyces sp. NPDC059582 TaxID=3346875 RepID=UPI0036A19410